MFPHQPLNGSLKYWSFFSYYSTYDVATFLPHRQNNKENNLQYFNDPFKGWCGKIFVF
jgi:hypothetical protein